MAAQIQLGVIVVTLVVGFCLLDVIFWILAARALNKPVDPQVLEQERRSAPPVTDPRRLRNFLPILAFTLVWTTVFGAIDAALCFTIMQQVRALNYATVEGQIVRSRLVPKSNPDDGWQLDLQYTYEVRGKMFSSDRFRYLTTPQGRWAEEIVVARPVQSPVTIYYNPGDPADALLVPGVSGTDLFEALILLPFNIATMALWCGLAVTTFRRQPGPGEPPAGVRVIRSEGMLRVRLPRVSPLLGTALGTGLVCFMLIFVGAVVNRPPVALMLGAFLTLRVFAQVLFSFLRRQVNSGKKDLVIDFFAETLTLPQTFGRTSAFTIPLDDVTIDVIEVYINQGRWYAPVVRWTDAAGRMKQGKLAEWWQEKAQHFVCWLRQEMDRGQIEHSETSNMC